MASADCGSLWNGPLLEMPRLGDEEGKGKDTMAWERWN